MAGDEQVLVEVPQGKLRGIKDKSALGADIYCFYRIPYARPPVGELRFQPPQPADNWSGVLDATKEGTFCPCADWARKGYLTGGAEDSLFINVFSKQSPHAGGRKLPVMVWVHGGGFEFGTGNRSMSGPDFLLTHDVIVVTFNYRIGVLGFLSLETVECPGNFGLKDQHLALRWVKTNIEHFGGDPDNITLFGISAGGASIHYQTLYPPNRGLFHRAIIQSGSVLNPWALARCPRANAFALGRRMGCDTTDDKVLLDFFKKAPIEDIVMKALRVNEDTEGEALGEWFINFTFVPSVEPEHDGAFMSRHPWMLMKEGKYLDVPIVAGVTLEEMIPGVRNPDDYPRFTKVEEFVQLIPRDIQLPRDGEKALAIAKRIKEFYFKDGVNLHNYIQILSDHFFNFGVFKYAKCRVNNKNIKSPTYLYLFTYEGNQPLLKNILGLADIKGACHGDDTGYILKTLFTNMEKMTPGSSDYDYMMKMTKLWTNFAKSGVPGVPELGITWKEASAEHLDYLELGESMTLKKDPMKERMNFWDNIYTCYYDEVDASSS